MKKQTIKTCSYNKLPSISKRLFFTFVSLFTLFTIVQTVTAAEFILDPVKKPIAATSTPVFTRNLDNGATGQDVSALQAILTLENQIKIPVTGTFGDVTKNALKTFQGKYPLEILIPAGLTVGDGIVSGRTMIKLNVLAAQYNIKLSDFAPIVVATSTGPLNVFNRNLTLGDRGDDVILLKKVLNSDPVTALIYPNKIAPAGTENLYDEATQIAVTKFQEKYASEILTPSGLTKGTGSVGYATRQKLNILLAALLSGKSSVAVATSSTTVKKFTGLSNIHEPNSWTWNIGDWGSCISTGWTFCAEEGGTCTVTGTKQIKYGNNIDGSVNKWVYKDFSKNTGCNNGIFGDPDPWVHKQCYISGGVKKREITKENLQYNIVNIPIPQEPANKQDCTPDSLPHCSQAQTITKNLFTQSFVADNDLHFSSTISKASYLPGEEMHFQPSVNLSLNRKIVGGNKQLIDQEVIAEAVLMIDNSTSTKQKISMSGKISKSGYITLSRSGPNVSLKAPKTPGSHSLSINWSYGTSTLTTVETKTIPFDVFDFTKCQ